MSKAPVVATLVAAATSNTPRVKITIREHFEQASRLAFFEMIVEGGAGDGERIRFTTLPGAIKAASLLIAEALEA